MKSAGRLPTGGLGALLGSFALRSKRLFRHHGRRRNDLGTRATYLGNNRILLAMEIRRRRLMFFIEANDKLITPTLVSTGRYDDLSTNFFLRELRTESHCIDAGANFGYFTCLMSSLCREGKVIGIEADQHISSLAQDNLLINELHAIAKMVHAAVGNSVDDMRLFRRVNRSGNTSVLGFAKDFTDFMVEPPVEEFHVRGVLIDDFLDEMEGRVDFIKIDVEGAEPLALAGSTKTISSNPQIKILMEWSPDQIRLAGHDIGDFLRSIDKMDMRAFSLLRGRPSPISWSELENLPYQSGIILKRR